MITQYTYSGDGTRLAQTVNGATTRYVIIVRDRPDVAPELERTLLAKLPDEANVPGGKLFRNGRDTGMRAVRGGYGKGDYAYRISDLDTAFGVDFREPGNPRLMRNPEMIKWGNRFNRGYGENLVTHGDLVSGIRSGNPLIRSHALQVPPTDLVHVYGSGGLVTSGPMNLIYEAIFGSPFPR